MKTVGLSLLLLMSVLSSLFAQQPMGAKEIPLPLPPEEIWQQDGQYFSHCLFYPHMPDLSAPYRQEQSLACQISNEEGEAVRAWFTDMGVAGTYLHPHFLSAELMKGWRISEIGKNGLIIMHRRGQLDPAGAKAFDKNGKEMWQYLFAGAKDQPIRGALEVIQVPDGFVYAYFNPSQPLIHQQHDDIVSVVMEKHSLHAAHLYVKKHDFSLPHSALKPTQDNEGVDIDLKLWSLEQKQHAVSVELIPPANMEIARFPAIEGAVHGTMIFKADGTVSQQHIIETQAYRLYLPTIVFVEGKYLIDRQGRTVMVDFAAQPKADWQVAYQTQLNFYNQQGQKLWGYPLYPSPSSKGKAICLPWSVSQISQNQYLVLCEQRQMVGQVLIQDSKYDQLLGIIINQAGQELKRFVVLNGDQTPYLYEPTPTPEWQAPVEFVPSIADQKLIISLANKGAFQGFPLFLTRQEWQKLQTQNEKTTAMGKILKLRLFVIPLPVP